MPEKDTESIHLPDHDAYPDVELEKSELTTERPGGFKDFVVSTQTQLLVGHAD